MRKGSPAAQQEPEGVDPPLPPTTPPAVETQGGFRRRWRALGANTGKEDVLAGLTVGVMAIPQSMAYALLAGLSPIYGLYTSLVPPFVYALLGGSRQLHVGPVSMVSLITATAIHETKVETEVDKAAVATFVAILAGLMQVFVGFVGLGGLVNFATLPIISGFTAGASIVVIVTQIQHIFGITVASGATSFHTLFNTIAALQHGLNIYSFALGVFFLFSLWFIKRQSLRYPKITALKAAGPLFVVVFGTLVTKLLNLQNHGVNIIGHVPNGLPKVTNWSGVLEVVDGEVFAGVKMLVPYASAVAFISFMESIAVAKTLAVHHDYELDAGKELSSLGFSLVAGSFFNAYAAAGAFSRSAVASGSGAKTQAAAIVASIVVGVTLLFLTPLFHYLPKGVLSAIVVHAVWGLIKISDLKRLIVLSYRDAALWSIAFVGTLFSVTVGLLLAVACSVALVVWDTNHPVVERVGQSLHDEFVPLGSGDVTVDPAFVLLAVKGTLHGACSNAIKQSIGAIAAVEKKKRSAEGRPQYSVVVDVSGVTSLDTTVMAALRDSIKGLAENATRSTIAYCGFRADLKLMVWKYDFFLAILKGFFWL